MRRHSRDRGGRGGPADADAVAGGCGGEDGDAGQWRGGDGVVASCEGFV